MIRPFRIALKQRTQVGCLAIALSSALLATPLAAAPADTREEAVAWARAGRLDAAIERLQQLRAGAADPRIAHDLVVVLVWADRHVEALDVWRELGATPAALPGYVRPSVLAALLAVDQRDAAATFAGDWRAAAPRDPAALTALGDVARRDNRRFDALRWYGEARAAGPDPALDARIRAVLADLGAVHGALAYTPAPALGLRAAAAGRQVRWAGAIPPATPAERHRRTDAALTALDELIRQAAAAGDAAVERGLRADRAVARAQRERWAEVLLDVAWLAARGDVPRYVRLVEAQAYMGLRRPQDAQPIYRQVLDAEPDNADARWGLFFALADGGEWRAAYAVVDAIAPSPARRYGGDPRDYPNEDWLYARILAAQVRSWADEHAAAWARLAPIVERAPGNAQARAALGAVAAARGWPRRADEELHIAASVAPDDKNIRIELADSALRRHRWTEARARLAALDVDHPGDPAVERVRRELAVQDRYEWRVNTTYSSENGGNARTPGGGHTLGTRLYSPALAEHWRVFGAAERMRAHSAQLYSGLRHRYGLGVEHRAADTTVEATLWDNTGSLTRQSAAVQTAWTPNDHWRFDADYETYAGDTPLRAIANGVTADAAGVGVTHAWSELTAASASYRTYDFTDGNRRRAWLASVAQRLYTAPDFKLTLTPGIYTSRNSATNVNYFSPAEDRTLSATLGTERVLSRRHERLLGDRFALTVGRYRQQGQPDATTGGVTYEQFIRIDPRFEVTYGAGWSRRSYDGAPTDTWLAWLRLVSRF